MALTIDEIKKLILSSIPDASIEIKDLVGDNNHYSFTMNLKYLTVKQKLSNIKLVYKSLKEQNGK